MTMAYDPISAQDIHDGTRDREMVLGPGYFAARRFAEAFMAGADQGPFKPVIEKVTKEIADELWQRVQDNLLDDHNIHLHIWQTVDQMVKFILSGEKWAVEKYALGDRYDCAKVREAIFQHFPKELRDKHIDDLEKEVENLKESLRIWRP
jgi:ATP-dependent Clp protease ATP-binding subunit ClpA